MPPTVLRVPPSEYATYMSTVVRRYAETLVTHWPRAMAEVAKHACPEPLSDDDVCEMIYHGAMARALTAEIDEEAAQLFADELASPRHGGRFVLNDMRCLEVVTEYLPGMYGSPSLTLFEEADDRLYLRAIALGSLVLRPEDGAAWELARYFVVQGSAYVLTVGTHPRFHLPMDVINAVTRKVLPAGHVLRALIEPHCFISLCVNHAVLYHRMSVVWNDQAHPYAPYATDRQEQLRLFKVGYAGHRGLPVWKPYRWPMAMPEVVGPYGRFLKAYHAVIARHVERTLESVQPGDPHVVTWAQEISQQLPGFPGLLEIAQPGVLARAVTSFVAGVSLHHSSDHANYGGSNPFKAPLRLRVPPPSSRQIPKFELSRLVWRRDMFRQLMAHEMFFKVHTIKPLVDVQYNFVAPELAGSARRFVEELRACKPGTRQYVPLEMIGTSIQS